MFSRLLQTITVPEYTQPSLEHGAISVETLRANLEVMKDLHRLQTGVTHIHTLGKDFADIRQLSHVIETQGLTRAVLMLSDADGSLSKLIPSIPSLESLDQTPLSSDHSRTRSILKGLSHFIGQEEAVIVSWLEETSRTLESLISNLSTAISDYRSCIETQKSRLAESSVSEDVLEATLVNTISASSAISALSVYQTVLGQLDAPAYNATDDDLNKAREVIGSLVSQLTPILGVTYDGSAVVSGGERSEEYTPSEGSLASKGYTPDQVSAVLDQAHAAVEAIQSLIDKKDDIIARFGEIVQIVAEPAPEPDPEVLPSEEPAAVEPATVVETEVPEDSEVAQEDGDAILDAIAAPVDDGVATDTAPSEASTVEPTPEVPPVVEAVSIHRIVVASWLSLLGITTEATLGAISDALNVGSIASSLADVVETVEEEAEEEGGEGEEHEEGEYEGEDDTSDGEGDDGEDEPFANYEPFNDETVV